MSMRRRSTRTPRRSRRHCRLPDAPPSATGRRKTSVARVTLTPGSGQFRINGRSLEDYFPRESLRSMIQTPLQLAGVAGRYDVRASLSGGGVAGQAGALRHGIARAVQMLDPRHPPLIKKAGLLTRDSREGERKKYGQRGARAPLPFSKRQIVPSPAPLAARPRRRGLRCGSQALLAARVDCAAATVYPPANQG